MSLFGSAGPCPAGAHGIATLKMHKCAHGLIIPAVAMCVWPAKQDFYISAGIIKSGTWRTRINELTRRDMICNMANKTTPERPWIMDAGANIGTVTMPLLAAGFNVMSFEAYPPNGEMIAASIKHLSASGVTGPDGRPIGKSILVRKAVTTPTGPESLCMSSGDGNNAGAPTITQAVGKTADSVAAGVAAASKGEVVCTQRVMATTIDQELKTSFPSGAEFAAMKMDIEGHEHYALAGAEEWFESAAGPNLVFIEVRQVNEGMIIGGFLPKHGFKCKKMHAATPTDFICHKLHAGRRSRAV